MEWTNYVTTSTTVHHRNRCILSWLGSLLPGRSNRGLLECGREGAPYQRARAPCGITSPQVVPEEGGGEVSHDQVRQYDSSSPYKQARWNKISSTSSLDQGNLYVMHGEEHETCSSTPPREGEHHSRLPVKTPQRQDRLDSESEYIPRDQQDLGATGGGSLRHTLLNPTASILQLESRSGGHSDRRLCPGVENTSSICTPSMVPHLKSVNEDPDGGGYNRTNHSSLAISAMVPGIAEHDSGCPNSPPRDSRPALSITELRLPSARVPAMSGRLESIRENLRARRIPENTSRLIISSWRDKTNTNYNSAWRKWDAWCAKRGLSSFTADVSAILSFLADEFEAGRQYRSLNCYRSALLSTLLPVEGIPVGQHPLVIRLLKGVFNLRPPMPRYTHTWDVSKVLTLLKEMGPNENLNLKRLTQKLVMLLALVLGQRCSDLVRLSLSGHSYTSDSVVLPCLGLAKQAKPKQCLQPVVIKSFKDKLLCPVACIRAYESSTSKLRTDGVWKLFLAVIPPHQPLTSSSIARWIKKSLKEAGIDECFTAHSTRAASATAAAMSGISTKEIMSRAGWSSEHTFTKFYYRPKAVADYGGTILQTCKETC